MKASGSNSTTPAAAPRQRHRRAYVTMLISSVISLYASFVLSRDAIRLAANPFTDLGCNVSEAISCTTVALSWQSSVLGFPNAFLGLMAEPVVITLAVAGLAGVTFPRWFMVAAQAMYSIGLGFAVWLYAQAYFVIGAMCPWCLLVTLSTITVFMSLTRVNLLDNNFRLPAPAHARIVRLLNLGADTGISVILYATIIAMVIVRYV